MLQSGPRSGTPAPRERPELPPARFFGKYMIVRKIAEGGFGEVYEAADVFSGRSLALKLPLINDDRALDDFLRELDIVGELEHPNVVPIIEAEWVNGLPMIVYPLGECSIADRIDAGGLWPSEAIAFAEQFLDGLAHVHDRGFLHCDLKPGNLIVFPGELLGISDFGLARDMLDEGVHTTSGTAEYMAPEHLNDGWVSTRSDVYEAAVVILEMLTGWLPENPLEIVLEDILPDSQWARAIEPTLRKALSARPEDRYKDAGEFASAFREAARGRRVH
ncbi:MAG: serine/threonine protein kinase [Myxococcales bacterium]|nr:serine/threonine protein kinase [Myxococcales bacterium]MCB9750016.1 serine/threonine protein kinase [Myxococcales bacterium]